MSEDEILASWDESVELLDAYEPLLSESQRKNLGLYFRYNLSLSEIAEECGLSRAAVFDAVKKGLKKLHHYEETLHLVRLTRASREAVEGVEGASSLEEARGKVRILKEELRDGI